MRGGRIKRVIIPESIINLGLGAFAQNDSLKSINIPHGITKIPDLLLAYSNEIDTIIIPDNITEIGAQSFQWDGDLSYIRLPKYLKRIEYYAFDGANIVDIVLPETLEFLGAGAFKGLAFLQKVYCMTKIHSIAELAELNFYSSPFYPTDEGATLYVSVGAGELYRNADGWKEFGNIEETGKFPSSYGVTFASCSTVMSSNGTIVVNNPTETLEEVSVYHMKGNLFQEEKVAGAFNFTVSLGIYLVRLEDKIHKIIVK